MREASGLLSTHGSSSPRWKGREWLSEAEFWQCHFLSCPCPRAILRAWGCSGHRVSPQLPQNSISHWHKRGHGSSGTSGTRSVGKQRTPRFFQSPGCSLNGKENTLSPWSSSWPTGGRTLRLWRCCLLIICAVVPRGGSLGTIRSRPLLLRRAPQMCWGDKDPTVLSALHPCLWFPVQGVCRLV